MPTARPSANARPSTADAGRRPLRPDDLYRLRVPTQVRLAPERNLAVFSLQTVAPRRDGYQHSIWAVPLDGAEPERQLTLGAGHDTQPRVSPNGRWLAFLSDRRTAVEPVPEASGQRRTTRRITGAFAPGRGPEPPSSGPEREDTPQVYLLPLDRPGEARRLTDLPRGVTSFEWSPDGARLALLSPSAGATREEDRALRGMDDPGPFPGSDYRYVDQLSFIFNGKGFVYDRRAQLWTVDVATGAARKHTEGVWSVDMPAWSPDGRSIAFCTNDRPDSDYDYRSNVFAVNVETGERTAVTGAGKADFIAPVWLPDGRTIACLGHRYDAHAASRYDVWLFAADGSEVEAGRNLSGHSDLMPATSMNSDITVGDPARLVPSADGAWLTLTAPIDGAYALWRISVADGRLERLTSGPEYVSGFDAAAGAGGDLAGYIRSTPTALPDVWLLAPGQAPRQLTCLNDEALAGIQLVEPAERWVECDGRRIQGWLMEAPEAARPAPLVVEIHGGPETQYGWSPVLEFQILAGSGMSVWYCNPRGSTGYGRDFTHANFRDWGDGPMRDVLAGVDALVAEGIADPNRLGVTGGSYGGYLTNWIVGHDRRFKAALTERSVSDLYTLELTGDLAGLDPAMWFGSTPWDDPEFYHQQSPITYIKACTTPLLIQHAEQDLRCPISQAEELFAVLRANRRPVRFMRVPGESHELTRSGTPFRRVENLVQAESWFRHYLIEGKRRLPPLPRERAGK